MRVQCGLPCSFPSRPPLLFAQLRCTGVRQCSTGAAPRLFPAATVAATVRQLRVNAASFVAPCRSFRPTQDNS